MGILLQVVVTVDPMVLDPLEPRQLHDLSPGLLRISRGPVLVHQPIGIKPHVKEGYNRGLVFIAITHDTSRVSVGACLIYVSFVGPASIGLQVVHVAVLMFLHYLAIMEVEVLLL